MTTLPPLATLYETERGQDIPLPPELARLYGRLDLPLRPDRPYVMGNFVTTLDGVVSLNEPGQAGGGEISGFNEHDRMVMGLLRAVAGAVVAPGDGSPARFVVAVVPVVRADDPASPGASARTSTRPVPRATMPSFTAAA